MKKLLSLTLALLMIFSALTLFSTATAADDTPETAADAAFSVTALSANCLYAHAAADGAQDSEAWVKWYKADGVYHFFLPSSAAPGSVELFSSYPDPASLHSTAVPAGGITLFDAQPDRSYTFTCGDTVRTVSFHFSTAEASLFVNNTDSYDGDDFFTYLQANKENSVAATGAVTTPDGGIENTEIKKIKGRGNTSWDADKKGYNVTLKNAASVAGMPQCKKFSLISNFQDAAMARNRILFDLSDEVGVPYSSDSRFVDFYTNGVYQGTYQLCQKVDVGKNTLVDDFEEDDYLDENGGVKPDFSFVCEIDSSPAEDDFHFSVSNGNNLTMKAPEVETSDPNYTAVRNYIRNKFNIMYNRLSSGAEDLDDYIDVTSLAKVYIINELGKNWDSGATSFYLTYKQDESGRYKFFASPVWDYDNSLGNARGVERDLRSMGISDYTAPSGWFSTKKNGYNGPNFLAQAIKVSSVLAEARRTWFEDFLPALSVLNSSGVDTGHLYSADVYESILSGTAEMNYHIWELVTDSSWIADHGSLRQYHADYAYNPYGQVIAVSLTRDAAATSYDQYTFSGQFDYMMDWLNSRAAWISAQYIDGYIPSEPPTEPETQPSTEPETQPSTEPEQPIDRPALDLSSAIAAWIFDAKGKTEGDKLTEYGSSDGYDATIGSGRLTLSVDGESGRALEWSAAEYNQSGAEIVPIMAAGSKNLWGAPYIRVEVPAEGYEQFALTMYLAASNKAPASWKLQYSTDGESFTDVPDASFTVTSERRKLLTAYFDRTAISEDADACETLTLQLIPVSMTTVSGGDTSDKPSGGEIALNYIIVSALPQGEFHKGDVNMSGYVDVLDATYIQRHLARLISLSDRQQALADVNNNGYIDILDATRIQRFLALLVDELEYIEP